MTETFVEIEQPADPENPVVDIRNVRLNIGGNDVLHQVVMVAKEDGTIAPPASETKQDTGNASLSSIDTKLTTIAGHVDGLEGSLSSIDGKVATSAKQDTLQASVGAITDAEATGDGGLIAILKRLRTVLGTISSALAGTLTVGLPSNASTLAEQQSQTTAVGSLTETAPASDTASSGLNGRLQRIAQRITSLIALLPTSLAAGGGLKVEGVAGGVAQPMSGTMKTSLSASSAVTISLASLASDTNLLAGRESSAIDNTTTRALDYLLAGKIRQGTTPTTGKEIRVYVVGTLTEAPTWPDVFDGTDSAETVTSSGIRDSVCRLAAVMATDSTSDRDNYFGPVSVASLFGGVLPAQFVVFVTHNTAVNLNSTGGNHVLSITPVSQTIS